ncbi:MAG: zinc ribbon domain-containing protein [bacterium]
MDDVERMYRHLVRTIRATFPQYLSQPFEVGELYQTILPYRLHRRELGLETNQDYELALMELLSGAHGYLIVDGKMRDDLSAERTSVSPNTAKIRDFASTHVALAPESLNALDGASRASGGGATISRSAITAASRTPAAQRPPTPVATEPNTIAATSGSSRGVPRPFAVADGGESCFYCKGELPVGRKISFCPHCGQDLTLVHCPACGSELERGWKFCVICGRGATEV